MFREGHVTVVYVITVKMSVERKSIDNSIGYQNFTYLELSEEDFGSFVKNAY